MHIAPSAAWHPAVAFMFAHKAYIRTSELRRIFQYMDLRPATMLGGCPHVTMAFHFMERGISSKVQEFDATVIVDLRGFEEALLL